jgi:hypothetical protein
MMINRHVHVIRISAGNRPAAIKAQQNAVITMTSVTPRTMTVTVFQEMVYNQAAMIS